MSILMEDSTNPAAIPDSAEMIAVYIDGLYRQVWANALAAGRFANTPKRRIAAVTVSTPSDTADFERYDLNPPDVVPWHANMTALGETNLWAYASRNERVAVEDAAWGAGIRDLSMWIATLDGTKVVAPYRYPVAAVQYTDTGSVDLSIVYQTFGPGGGTIGGEEMQPTVYRNPVDGSEWQVDWIAYVKHPINAATAAQLDKTAKAMGLPGLTIIDNANVGLDMIPIATPPSPPPPTFVPHTHTTDKGTP